MPYRSGKLVSIATLDDSVEVSLLGALFDERGIRYVMDSQGDSAFAGVFETQRGQAKLKVFEEDAEVAREILKNFLEALSTSENDEEERNTAE